MVRAHPGADYIFHFFFPQCCFVDAGCDITDDCDLNAECVSEEGKGHKCHCNDGFQGDGKTCEKLVIGCNVIDNCDKYASCLFSKVEGGYRCKCDTERVSTECPNIFCTGIYHFQTVEKGEKNL